MIKKIVIPFLLLLVMVSPTMAQDTSAYEIQRAKVNGLLAERSSRFGQYDQSLNTKTGIFGLQTKRDIRNSNEILRQIALTDNDIFKELKVLLDYKDLQVEQAKTTSSNSTESILNYRKTIKDLQVQNQKLEEQLQKSQSTSTIAHLFMILFLIGCAILAYFLNQKIKLLRLHEKESI